MKYLEGDNFTNLKTGFCLFMKMVTVIGIVVVAVSLFPFVSISLCL